MKSLDFISECSSSLMVPFNFSHRSRLFLECDLCLTKQLFFRFPDFAATLRMLIMCVSERCVCSLLFDQILTPNSDRQVLLLVIECFPRTPRVC